MTGIDFANEKIKEAREAAREEARDESGLGRDSLTIPWSLATVF
jgi:hypothetical protein